MYQLMFLDANWNNGVFMIVIFALVCIVLVGILINFMMSGKKRETESEDPEETINLMDGNYIRKVSFIWVLIM